MTDSTAPYHLVVEDDADVRRGLVAALRETFAGADVSEAPDLRTARARLSAPGRLELGLFDLGLPDGTGIDLLRDARRRHPGAQLVVATVFDDDEHLFGALAAGADGYVLKDASPEAMRAHLKRLASGEPVLSPSVARRILRAFRPAEGASASAATAAPTVPESGRGLRAADPASVRGLRAADPSSVRGLRAADPASVRGLRAEGEIQDPPGSEPSLTPRQVEVLGLVARGLRVGEVAQVLGLSDQTVAGYVKDIYRKLDISSRAEAALEAAKRGLV